MSDRNSADIFGSILTYLSALNQDQQSDLCGALSYVAEQIYDMSEEYDFSPEQMGCDAALREFGLLDEEGVYL